MAVNSSGVPLFAGIESLDDMFMTTLEEMDKEIENHIDIHDPLYKYLKKHNLIEYRDSIGTHVPVRLLDKPNSTVKDFSHYDDVDMTPQDALSEGKFAYGHIVGTQMYSREELTKNSGKEQLIDLVETKMEQLQTSMTNHFSTRIKGTQDADGRQIMGIGRVLAFDQSCGGIDPTAAGFGYWNPQKGVKASGAQFALATEMRAGLRRLTRLCTYQGEAPDVLRCGEDVYDMMQAWAEEKLQLTLSDIKKSAGWGDFEMFEFNGRTIIYDADLAAKRAELLNFKKGIKVRIHRGTNFQFTNWKDVSGKVAKSRECLVYASVYTKRRNANGYIEFT
jgi:hypothetical protein